MLNTGKRITSDYSKRFLNEFGRSLWVVGGVIQPQSSLNSALHFYLSMSESNDEQENIIIIFSV